jgi:hypothetical protein
MGGSPETNGVGPAGHPVQQLRPAAAPLVSALNRERRAAVSSEEIDALER